MFPSIIRVCTEKIVRRDEHSKDGSSSSSRVEMSNLIEMKNDNEMVTVNNNCVNIDYNNANHDRSNVDDSIQTNVQSKFDDSNNNDEKNVIRKDEKIVNSLDAALDEFHRQLSDIDGALSTSLASYDDAKINIDKKIDDLNDDDALATSSNYSDIVSSRCEMSSLPPQPSSSTSALLPHVAQYAPTRDNNRNHRKAVRKNFSLWIGVTSCVWACLVWLMKNYA
jgi:hypothetical protein